VVEAGNDQVFRAELPGSAVLVAAAKSGGGERLFTDAPIDDVDVDYTRDIQEGPIDEKRHERLFSDTPVNEGDATLDLESRRRPLEKERLSSKLIEIELISMSRYSS
jgi:hypothetical protein